eukprot:CFRG2709T1
MEDKDDLSLGSSPEEVKLGGCAPMSYHDEMNSRRIDSDRELSNSTYPEGSESEKSDIDLSKSPARDRAKSIGRAFQSGMKKITHSSSKTLIIPDEAQQKQAVDSSSDVLPNEHTQATEKRQGILNKLKSPKKLMMQNVSVSNPPYQEPTVEKHCLWIRVLKARGLGVWSEKVGAVSYVRCATGEDEGATEKIAEAKVDGCVVPGSYEWDETLLIECNKKSKDLSLKAHTLVKSAMLKTVNLGRNSKRDGCKKKHVTDITVCKGRIPLDLIPIVSQLPDDDVIAECFDTEAVILNGDAGPEDEQIQTMREEVIRQRDDVKSTKPMKLWVKMQRAERSRMVMDIASVSSGKGSVTQLNKYMFDESSKFLAEYHKVRNQMEVTETLWIPASTESEVEMKRGQSEVDIPVPQPAAGEKELPEATAANTGSIDSQTHNLEYPDSWAETDCLSYRTVTYAVPANSFVSACLAIEHQTLKATHPVTATSSRLVVSGQVDFTKKTLMKSTIDSSAIKSIKESQTDFVEVLKKFVTPSCSGASQRRTRKGKEEGWIGVLLHSIANRFDLPLDFVRTQKVSLSIVILLIMLLLISILINVVFVVQLLAEDAEFEQLVMQHLVTKPSV